MIIKGRMRFGITLFGRDWGFFYDVHYFVPYAEYMRNKECVDSDQRHLDRMEASLEDYTVEGDMQEAAKNIGIN